MTSSISRATSIIALGLTVCGAGAAFGQGTAFTYQGRLNAYGAPADGTYDLTFSLFDAGTAGSLLAGPQTNSAVVISNGLFTVTLDFGAQFPGAARWLEIAVRTNAAATLSTLTPRQALTPAPYSITAGNVVSGGLSGAYTNPVSLNNSANQIIGTFSGNGAGVSNVNATTLNGFGATNFWQTGGNAGTTAGLNYLGTADNQPLEVRVYGGRALRLEPGPSGYGAPNVIGGSVLNWVSNGVAGATIGGGGHTNDGFGGVGSNSVSGFWGTIGGGTMNTAGLLGATVGGGVLNTASARWTTVGGGQQNIASSDNATVAGGELNTAAGSGATVGGGYQNTSSGLYATVSGGTGNTASGVETTVGGGAANAAVGDSSTVAGGFRNAALGYGSFVGGGGADGSSFFPNHADGAASTVAGGIGNHATNGYATVGGGYQNTAGGPLGYGTVGGGYQNIAGGTYSTVAGGDQNSATGSYAAAGGGFANVVSGTGAMVPGGVGNSATGAGSFAAGQLAHAVNSGAFVWGDGTVSTSSGANNQFAARASGGFVFYTSTSTTGAQLPAGSGSWSSMSDRNAKNNFTPVDSQAVLARVVSLPLSRWSYLTEPGVRHVGPMAQDFYSAFEVGADDRHIAEVDEGGVALAAIQGLNQKVEKGKIAAEATSRELERRLEQKNAEIDELKARLGRLEQLLRRQ